MPAATRLRVEFRGDVNHFFFPAHGTLRLIRSEGRKAGTLSVPSFFGEFFTGEEDEPGAGAPLSRAISSTSPTDGGGTSAGDVIAAISPVKCSVGARARASGDLDYLHRFLGPRFFSVRSTEIKWIDGADDNGPPAGHLCQSEHVRVSGATFHVWQIIEGQLQLGAHVVRIDRIEEKGRPWKDTGVRTAGNFVMHLDNDRRARVRFVQIYEPDTFARPRKRGRPGTRSRVERRPWRLTVDVTRFDPRPEGVVYETQSRFQFRPLRKKSD